MKSVESLLIKTLRGTVKSSVCVVNVIFIISLTLLNALFVVVHRVRVSMHLSLIQQPYVF